MQEPHYTGIRVETREHNHLAISGPSGPCPIANTVCYYRSIVCPGVTSDQCIPRGHPVLTGPSPLSSQHAGASAGDKYPHYLRAKYLGAECRLYRDVFIRVSVDIDITGEFWMEVSNPFKTEKFCTQTLPLWGRRESI